MRIKINGPQIEETFKVTELMGEARRPELVQGHGQVPQAEAGGVQEFKGG